MIQHARLLQASDFAAIEARGLDAYLSDATPLAMLRRSATALPEHEAIRFLRDVTDSARDISITYSQLHADVCRAANLFRQLGVAPGETVALLMPHVPIAQVALWGAEAAAMVCSINPMLQTDHLAGLLRAAKAKVAVVCGPTLEINVWDKLLPVLREAGVTFVMDAESESPAVGSDGRFEDLIAPMSPVFDDMPAPDAPAALFHTGGTTGAPKLVRHTQRNQSFVARGAALMFDLRPEDILINGFPLFHVAGCFVYGLSAISAGTTMLIPSRLGMRNRAFTASIWQQVERHRVTLLGAVPTFLSACSAVAVDADISTLRAALTGGSPLPPELADAFERHTGVAVRNIFGMTESAGVVTIEPFHLPRTAGSAGLPLPFTEVRAFRTASGNAVDPGAPLAAGETGELALRGPQVSPGYTEAHRNAGTFEADGWLVSGDLGHVDDQGRVFITGRAKDVIIRGAHNIDPSQIESALMRHGDVLIAAAVGQPDPYAGELPVAFVVLREGSDLTAADLLDFITPHLPEPAARPRRVSVLETMPLTPIGKIFKPHLRQMAIRQGVIDALAGSGLDLACCRIETSEAGIRLQVTDITMTEAAKQALLGMPIKYEITTL